LLTDNGGPMTAAETREGLARIGIRLRFFSARRSVKRLALLFMFSR
jgi:hypothetical protein